MDSMKHFSKNEIIGIILWCVALAAILWMLVMPSCAKAQSTLSLGWNEFSGGPSGYDFLYSWRANPDYDVLTTQFDLGRIYAPPYGNTKFGAASFVLVDKDLYTGIGIAYVTADLQPRITSHFNFYLTTGIRFSEHWGFAFHHISNGGTQGQNFGENIFAATYTW